MKISSRRHANRRLRLLLLIKEEGGATALSVKVGTPKSHISAISAGTRGMGDELAAKLERKCDKPAGWMDLPLEEGSGAETAHEPGATYGASGPELSPTEWDLLQEFRDMSEEDKAFLRDEASARSQRFKKLRQEVLASIGIGGAADPASVTKALGSVPKESIFRKDRPHKPEPLRSLDTRGKGKAPATGKKSRTE